MDPAVGGSADIMSQACKNREITVTSGHFTRNNWGFQQHHGLNMAEPSKIEVLPSDEAAVLGFAIKQSEQGNTMLVGKSDGRF